MKSTVQLISTAFAVIALLTGSTAKADTTAATTTLNLTTPLPAISGGFGVYSVARKQISALSPDAQTNLLTKQTVASPADLNILLTNIVAPSIRAQATAYLVNIVQWQDVAHTAQPTSNWYLLESEMLNSAGNGTAQHFYLESDQDVVKRTTLQGQKNILLVYLYLRASDSPPIDPGTSEDVMMSKNSNPYKVVITEAPSAFKSDLKTLLGILNIPALNAAAGVLATGGETVEGFTASYLITDPYDTSTIQITSAYDFSGSAAPSPVGVPAATAPAAGTAKASAATISSPSFSDQPLTFVGLSIAFPVTSYKQVTYTSSSGTLLPQSATEQSLYANLDFYLPAVDPDLIALRWLPHPFIGLPLSGKVLDHPMAGIAVSLKYGEIFWGAIDDLQNENSNGSSHHTIKGVFGIKFSVSAAKTLLGSK